MHYANYIRLSQGLAQILLWLVKLCTQLSFIH